MSDFDNVVPDWGDVPEDDTAEPDDLAVEHTATPEEVEEAVEAAEKASAANDEDQDDEAEDIDQYHTGNGWYDLPGQEGPVHGKEAARKALAESTEDEA